MGAVQVLVVAGGGGGGNSLAGGGGGAGGVVYNPSFTISNQSYSVTVGGGGGAQANGGNSVFSSITAVGGGAGGGGGPWNAGVPGNSGGSGGGGSGDYSVARAGGSGTAGQGNTGGASTSYSNGAYKGGGGGGAGATGTAASATSAGNGGVGVAYSISGSSVYYGGGGGGSVYRESGTNTIGTGGTGGGGNGENHLNGSGIVTAAVAGAVNTGGGGGGSAETAGAAGGSGIVIIRYPTGSVTATGGTVTTSGGDTIHTFTSSGTFNVTASVTTTSDSVAMKQRPLSQTRFIDDPNLVAYWPMDGNSNDTKGGFNGTDTAVSYTTGKFGSAASYNGSTSVTSVTGMSTQLSRDSTFSCWINITSFGASGTAGVFMESDVASYSNYFKAMYTYNSAGTMSIQFAKYDGAANPGTSVGSVTTGQWYYLCGVQRGTTLELYLNGNLVSTATDSTTTVPGYSNFKLGAQTSQAGRYFTGLIDDAAVFNRALGREEIAEIYQGFVQSESLPTIRPIGGIYSTSLINDANLVSYWRLDGNSRDSKGSNHGTDSAMTYQSGSGRFGQGGVFNGSSSKITTPTISLGTTFTVSLWVKFTSTARMFICGEAAPSGSLYSWFCYAESGNVYFLGKGSTEQTGVGITSLNDGNWHHVVGIYTNNSNIIGYCDGVYVGTATITTTFTYRAFTIGYGDDTFWGAFGGNIDDISLFTRALSVSEIQTLYETGSSATFRPLGAIPSLRNDSSLVSYWGLNDNVTDAKGANNGTASNITYNTGVTGLFGRGAVFNGSSSYVSVGQNNIFNSSFTLSAWFRTTSYGTVFGCQATTVGTTPGEYNPIIYVGTDYKVRGGIYNAVAAPPLFTSATYNDNRWHHAVVVGNTTTGLQYLYVDGVFIMSANRGNTATLYNNIGVAYTGGAWTGGSAGWHYFNGSIDDVAIFNRALTAEEVRRLYSATTIAGYWKLNGNSTDYSGNGNHGTDTSVTYSTTIGKYGLGASFSGSSIINAGNGGSLQITGAISVGCWIKTTQSMVYRGMVSKMSTGSPNYGWLLRMYAASIPCAEFGISSTGSDYTNVLGTSNINDGKWHYIVGVFAPGAFIKIYVDGVCQATNTTSIPTKIFNTAGPVILGASYSNINEPTVGFLEEVIIENGIKSDSEIKKYYTKTAGRFGII